MSANKRRQLRNQKGQGITEYASVLAFVALLVATVFSTAKGSLFATLSVSYNAVNNALQILVQYASSQ